MVFFFLTAMVIWVGIREQPASASFPEERPNILMILVDDLGYGDLSCFGSSETRTPRLDALAREGKMFTSFRANCSVCSPTRAALLSGVVPDRCGVPGVIRTHAENSWGYFSSEIDTLPQILKTAGYHTAIIGKWHLGLESPNLPRNRGFDRFQGFLGDMMDDYQTHLRHKNNYMRDNEKTIDPEGHATDLFTDWACKHIRERARKSEPFFLYLAYNAPHSPIQPKEEWVKRVRERNPGLSEKRLKYLALVEHLDDSIGKVLDVLDEMEIAENTLVVFTSDNGGSLGLGASNGELRDGKGSMYEGGLRVPMIVRWPRVVRPETETTLDAFVADLFPTFLEAARCETRPGQELDGVSLMPVLLDRETDMPARDFYFVRREGGNPFFGLTSESIISGNWKLVHNSPSSPFEMFDLANDPQEKNNLAQEKTEQFREMRLLLQRRIQIGGGTPWQAPPRVSEE